VAEVNAAIVAAASVVGMLLPMVLSRFRLDPATASVPLVTSLADIFGILIYFALAVAIFNITIGGA
jgi:magnesium transporter